MRWLTCLGWVAVVVSVGILLVFGGHRIATIFRAPNPDDLFGIRYVRHPFVAMLHILPGVFFLTLAPLQFVPRIRNRHLAYHRAAGRVLVLCGVISGVFAIVAAFRFPAFGGAVTQAATVVFGSFFLVSLGKAVHHVRRKRFALHREWMIRAFALAAGVASIRVFIGLLGALAGLDLEESFGLSFWLGFGVNVVAAEAWILATRTSRTTHRADPGLDPTKTGRG